MLDKQVVTDPWKLLEQGLHAFDRYAQHLMRCHAWGPGPANRRCDCGLEDVRRVVIDALNQRYSQPAHQSQPPTEAP
jgi:hypothetical protein